jgi:hypothetical protein
VDETTAFDVDARALADDLRAEVRGEVRFDAGSRALYTTDSSNYRQVPIGVVLPCDREDVIATMATCRRHDVPVLARGGGTSIPGQCCKGAPKSYKRLDKADAVTREFCVECGTHMITRRPGLSPVVLKIGTLDDPSIYGRAQMATNSSPRAQFPSPSLRRSTRGRAGSLAPARAIRAGSAARRSRS